MASSDAQDREPWGPEKEKMLIDILVDEVNKGSMVKGVFPARTWEYILREINKCTNKVYTTVQVKQKFNSLHDKHHLFGELLHRTGFGWNAETNTVHALEKTWQTFLRAHPEAAQFRNKGCEHYNLLGIIFNKSTATGILHFASTQDPPNTDDENELEEEFLNSSVYVEADLSPLNDPVMPYTQESLSQGRNTTRICKKKRKKESWTNQMAEAIMAWAEASKARTKVYLLKTDIYMSKRAKSIEASSSVTRSDFTITNCITALEALNAIEAIDDDTYISALMKFKDLDNREIFMAMPLERKKAWLAMLK